MELKSVAPIATALLSVVLLSTCGGDSPSAPSSPSQPPPVDSPAPPAPDLSQLIGVWNVSVRLTNISGGGCVAETMRPQIGVPTPYVLSIAQKGGGATVTLKSASGDRACAFTPSVDSSSFTTYGQGGYYTCEPAVLNFRCSDGTRHAILSLGEDISGRVSGNEINGTWDASWTEMPDAPFVDTKAEFTGSRQ